MGSDTYFWLLRARLLKLLFCLDGPPLTYDQSCPIFLFLTDFLPACLSACLPVCLPRSDWLPAGLSVPRNSSSRSGRQPLPRTTPVAIEAVEEAVEQRIECLPILELW